MFPWQCLYIHRLCTRVWKTYIKMVIYKARDQGSRSLSQQDWILICIILSTYEYNYNTSGHHDEIFLQKTGVATCVVYSNWLGCSGSPKCITVPPWWLSSVSQENEYTSFKRPLWGNIFYWSCRSTKYWCSSERIWGQAEDMNYDVSITDIYAALLSRTLSRIVAIVFC